MTTKPTTHTTTPWRFAWVSYPEDYSQKYKFPGGWQFKNDKGDFECIWSEAANRPVCVAQDASSYQASLDWLNEKDADFLLCAVNNHEELLRTLEHLLNAPELLTDKFYRDQIKELIDKCYKKGEN